MFIDLQQGNEKKKVKFKINENIYSYQISNISEQLIHKRTKPNFPSMDIEEIEINTKLLDQWMDTN